MQKGQHKATGSTIPIYSLDDFADAINNRYLISDWYFRGEPNEYDRPFLPSVWRTGHAYTDQTPLQPETSFSVGELSALKQCQSDLISGTIEDTTFIKYFQNPSDPIDLSSVDFVSWLGLAQHYNQGQRYPTRLVDITRDPYVGLYFAVSSNFDSPGYVFAFKDNFNELGNVGTISQSGSTFLDVLKIDGKGGLSYHPQDVTLNLMEPPFPNKRLEAQKGVFIWNRAIGGNYRTGGFSFEIHPENKKDILNNLKTIGYDDSTLFPC
ncbi:FRG domain-containing protein [Desulfobulbus propionicus]